MRIVVTGGRSFKDRKMIYMVLDAIHAKHNITVLREGEADGVDRICGQWAATNGIFVERYPADWTNLNVPGCKVRNGPQGPYNANAGKVRNKEMLEGLAAEDCAVIFPGGAGTMHMASLITACGVKSFNATEVYEDCCRSLI